jgi:ribonucleoside-diphosphate reductase alpha chain
MRGPALVGSAPQPQSRVRKTRNRGDSRRRSRPGVLRGATQQMRTPFGSVFVTVNLDEEGHPFEVFIRLDKAGSRAMADAEGIARLLSLALRWGIPAAEIHRQLRGISCEAAGSAAGARVLSIPDAVAQAMEELVDGLGRLHPEEV